ncbi:MAG: SIS domain-containing protein [Geminicoccaceae bacterium]|nr:SIS domain-containing protein [Geminicoccaceae bacterium]
MQTLDAYLEISAETLQNLKGDRITRAMEQAVAAIVGALSQGRPLLICGNGGSAADATHIAGEIVGRFLRQRRAYNAIALTTDPAVLTAVGNDYGYDEIFARQVEAHGGEGAVLVAITTSGNSANVLRAAEVARGLEMTVVGLTGRGGGELAKLSDILLDVPVQSTPLIQQAHQCLYHFLCEAVENRLADGE